MKAIAFLGTILLGATLSWGQVPAPSTQPAYFRTATGDQYHLRTCRVFANAKRYPLQVGLESRMQPCEDCRPHQPAQPVLSAVASQPSEDLLVGLTDATLTNSETSRYRVAMVEVRKKSLRGYEEAKSHLTQLLIKKEKEYTAARDAAFKSMATNQAREDAANRRRSKTYGHHYASTYRANAERDKKQIETARSAGTNFRAGLQLEIARLEAANTIHVLCEEVKSHVEFEQNKKAALALRKARLQSKQLASARRQAVISDPVIYFTVPSLCSAALAELRKLEEQNPSLIAAMIPTPTVRTTTSKPSTSN